MTELLASLRATEQGVHPSLDQNNPEHKTEAPFGVGFSGLANFKTRDPSYAFYEIFEPQASRVLQLSALKLKATIAKLQALEQSEMDSLHTDKPDYKHSKPVKKLLNKMGGQLLRYYDLFIKTHTILSYDQPNEERVEWLETWKATLFQDGADTASSTDPDDFRFAEPGPRKLDTLALNLANIHALPFLKPKRSDTDQFFLSWYSKGVINAISGHLVLLLVSFFLLFPFALVSYRLVSRVAATSVVLVLCLLAVYVARFVDQRGEAQLVLIFAYVAIMCTLLQGMP